MNGEEQIRGLQGLVTLERSQNLKAGSFPLPFGV